ncbi:MAG: ATP-grasp domain-containing protein, partial [Bacteroidetes bacterium]
DSIRLMGSKLAAKEAVKKFDIPLVPGLERAVRDVAEAKWVASEIGYPVLIKASAGGGGKGMRIVHSPEELPEQMERAVSEARSAFGDGAVFIEKYIASPRHVEIQVLADAHGNTVHLYERECSIQRRHQKVVEEAPSAVLTPAVRRAMGRAAVRVAQACNYLGAGTVEFLVDEELNFYFLEMNTRLQVEHPVTECITGLDLVEQQIRIARGEPLAFSQDSIPLRGHAIELRVYAENPFQNFLPNVGRLERYRPPQGAGIRLDSGYEEGLEVPIYYDPLIAKLITWGESREAAIRRMREAILGFEIEGVVTTLPFGRFVMEHPAFVEGKFDTHFVEQHFTPEVIQEMQRAEAEVAAAVAAHWFRKEWARLRLPGASPSRWPLRKR